MRTVRTAAVGAVLCLVASLHAFAQSSGPFGTAQLEISGARLTLYADALTTDAEQTLNVGEAALVRTCYGSGGACGTAAAGSVPGLTVAGDLSGPELPQAVPYTTAPGGTFFLPGFQREGDYVLANIRLVETATGRVLANAEPSLATLHVRQILLASASVTRLTLADLQARGITINQQDFSAFTFAVGFVFSGTTVRIELPVLYTGNGLAQPLDKPVVKLDGLPPAVANAVKRWQPPTIVPFQLNATGPRTPSPGGAGDVTNPEFPLYGAIVLPGNVSFLNQFFDAKLIVANGAPDGSGATLQNVTGSLKLPAGDVLRLAATTPPVAAGQKLPVLESNGLGGIGPSEQGTASWTVEGLAPGTHVLRLEIEADLARPGRPILVTGGVVQAAVEVVDARFQLAFNHPDVVRTGEPYSIYVTVTNLSRAAQNLVTVDLASENISGAHKADAQESFAKTIPTLVPGAFETLEYRLVADVTGTCVATTFQATGGLSGVVHLRAGVGEAGIPLSPAALVLPRFTDLLPKSLVDGDVRLLGLAYSLATAPAGAVPAGLPHPLKADVERRAIDLGEAGQRLYLQEKLLESLEALALDQLGNRHDLPEYDGLRRTLDRGAQASTALGDLFRQEQQSRNLTAADFVKHFASTVSYGRPWTAAALIPNGSQPSPSLELRQRSAPGVTSLAGTSEDASRVRGVPYGEVYAIHDVPGGTKMPFAVVGRLDPATSYAVDLHAHATGASGRLVLVVPTDDLSGFRKVDFGFVTMGANEVWEVGAVRASGGAPPTFGLVYANSGLPVPGAPAPSIADLSLPPFRVIGAVQDPELDRYGLGVSYLFNRPPDKVSAETPGSYAVRSTFHGQDTSSPAVTVDRVATKTGAAAFWQPNSERVVNVRYDSPVSALNGIFDGVSVIRHEHLLATNAIRDVHGTPLDPQVPPLVVDPDRTGGLAEGRVVRGDGTPAAGTRVQLLRWRHVEPADGSSEGYDVLDLVAETTTGADDGFYFDFIEEPPPPGRTVGTPPNAFIEGVKSGFTLRAIVPAGADPILQPEEREEVSTKIRLQNRLLHVDIALLGRGTIQGRLVHADDGSPVTDGTVSAASTLFSEQRTLQPASDGSFTFGGLPVGPITLSGRDVAGNRVYQTVGIQRPGEIVNVTLLLGRTGPPKTGTVSAKVLRLRAGSPRPPPAPSPGASVAVYANAHFIAAKTSDNLGNATFTDVPVGKVTLQAADFGISRTPAVADLTLVADATVSATLTLAQAAPRSVVGRVLFHDAPSNTNVPVAGAVAFIAGPGVFAYTDATGTYRIEGVPVQAAGEAAYAVTAFDNVRGLQGRTALPPVVEGDGSPILAADILLVSMSGGIDGVVLDPLGRPYGGAEVELDENIVATSGGDGRFSFDDIAVGTWNVVAHVGDGLVAGKVGFFGQATAGIVFGGHRPFVTIRMAGSGVVNVTTRSSGSQGVLSPILYRPTMVVGPAAIGPKGGDPVQTSTDADGHLTLVLPVGPFSLTAVNPLNGNRSFNRSIDYPGQVVNLDVVFDSASTVTGHVVGVDGVTPVPGADVSFVANGLLPQTQRTDGQGAFRFELVPQGAVSVTAAALVGSVDRVGRADGVVTGPGQTLELTVVMKAQGTVRGRVVDLVGGVPTPLAFAQFTLQESGYPNRRLPAGTGFFSADAQGAYEVSHVFAGAVTVVARDRNQVARQGSARGEITADFQVLTLPDVVISTSVGSLGVTVRDPDSGGPVADAQVTLSNGDVAVADGNGQASFDALPLGTYSVHAFDAPTGRAGLTSGLALQNPGDRVDAVVLLDTRGQVGGTLWDDAAKTAPVGGGTVQLTGRVNGRTWGTSISALATTSSDPATLGRFLFDGMPPGSYALAAGVPTSPRRAAASLTTSPTAPVASVDLVLEPVADRFVRLFENLTAGVAEVNPANGVYSVTLTQSAGCPPGCTYAFTASAPSTPYPGHLYLFPDVLAAQSLRVTAQEASGTQRSGSISGTGAFAGSGTPSDPYRLVLRAKGRVTVTVRDALGQPAQANATLDSAGGHYEAATDTSGVATFQAVLSGTVYAAARVASTGFGGTATGVLQFDDQTLALAIALAPAVSAHGVVYHAPPGDVWNGDTAALAPESGAIVQIRDSGGQLQIVTTGTDGAYRFPVLRTGPYTIGATDAAGAALATGAGTLSGPDGNDNALPPLVLDAARPVIVSIVPPPGSVAISRNAPVEITFSERLLAAVLPAGGPTSPYFTLRSATGLAPPGAWTASVDAAGRQIVRFTPAGLYENSTVYSLTIAGGPSGVRDLAGRPVTDAGDVGSNFTTSDTVGPVVTGSVPSLDLPVDPFAPVRFDFSEAVTATPEELDGSGPTPAAQLFWQQNGSPDWLPIPITMFLSRGGYSLVVQPPTGVTYQNDSLRRRAHLSRLRDGTGNPMADYDKAFRVYDQNPPRVDVAFPPGAPTGQLVGGTSYTLTPSLSNLDDLPQGDVDRVEYFLASSGDPATPASAPAFTGRTAPYAFTFVAAYAGNGVDPRLFPVWVKATDTSTNASNVVKLAMSVLPNAPPVVASVAVAATAPVAGTFYAGSALAATALGVADPDGASLTLTAELRKDNPSSPNDPADLVASLPSQAVPRPAGGWAALSPPVFASAIPLATPEGTTLFFRVKATDALGASAASESARFAVAHDANAPVVDSLVARLSGAASPGTLFTIGQKFVLEFRARDAETAVRTASVTLSAVFASPQPVALVAGTTNLYRTAELTVPATVPPGGQAVTASAGATDWGGNVGTLPLAFTVSPTPDPYAPVATWLTPWEGGAWPAGYTSTVSAQGTALLLRARAADVDRVGGADVPGTIASVQFRGPIDAAGTLAASFVDGTLVAGTGGPGAGIYEALWRVPNGVAAGTQLPFQVRVVDAGANVTTADVRLRAAPPRRVYEASQVAVLPGDAMLGAGGDVAGPVFLLDGTLLSLYPQASPAVRALPSMYVYAGGVAAGASFTPAASVLTAPEVTSYASSVLYSPLELAVTDAFGLGHGARVDLTAKGLLGSTATQSMVLPGQTGPQLQAGGSHGGSGGPGSPNGGWARSDLTAPGSSFDLVTDPALPGGGGGQAAGPFGATGAGGTGGGVVRLLAPGAVVHLEGDVLADGGNGPGDGGGGSIIGPGGAGGTIRIVAGRLEGAGRLSAAGGRGTNGNYAGGGGGGRIALSFADPPAAGLPLTLAAPGGLNALPPDAGAQQLGGAGTIHLEELDAIGAPKAPGRLLVANAAGKPSWPTPFSGPQRFGSVDGRGAARLVFADSLSVGATDPPAVNDRASVSLDASARLLLATEEPAIAVMASPDGGSVNANQPITLTWTASDPIGIETLTAAFSPQAPTTGAYADEPLVVTQGAQPLVLTVPTAQPPGPITYTLTATDRAGRVATAQKTWNVAADTTPPVVSVTGLAPGGVYHAGQVVTATVTATDDGAIATLRVLLDGQTFPLTGAGPAHAFSYVVPADLAAARDTTFQAVATDAAGNAASTTPVAIHLLLDAPPALSLTGVTPGPALLPGATIAATANASDDVAVTKVVFTVSGAASTTDTRLVNATSTTQVFAYRLPFTLTAGQSVTLQVDAFDTFGHEVSAAPVTYTILADTTAPAVSPIALAPPKAGDAYDSGDVMTFTVTATDDVGVASIRLTVNGQVTDYTASPAVLTFTAPPVDGSTPMSLDAEVRDYAGNLTTASKAFTVNPTGGGTYPVVQITCPSDGAFLPSAYAGLLLTATATDAAGISRIEFYRPGDVTPFYTSTPSSGTPSLYTGTSSAVTLPTVAGDTVVRYRARAYNPANHFTETFVDVHAVPAVDVAGATATDFAVLRSGTLVVDAPLTFAGLIVLRGATVTHSAATGPGGEHAANVTVNGPMYVECGGTIDASGRGYPATTTYPGATSGADWAGGSHVGASGTNGVSPIGTTYGSVYRPQEAGAGAVVGGAGGGIVRVSAGTLTVDGAIRANGALSSRGGGGGSVWVTATALGGSGSIEAKGGEQQYEAGGGGAIAVEYSRASGSVLSNLVARGGAGQNATASGGAGTVYVNGPGSTFGDVRIDNKAVSGQPTVLPSFGAGTAQAGTAGSSVVMDKVAWPGTYFAGHWVEVRSPDGTLKGTWRIGSVTNSPAQKTVPGNTGLPLQDGNVYDGYLIYSDIPLASHVGLAGKVYPGTENNHVFGARYSGGQWQHDNNSTFNTFTPDPGDRVFGTYKGGVSNVTRLTCPLGVCGAANGLPVLQAVAGDITPNFDPGAPNAGEIWVHDLVLASGLARFALVPNGAETIDVQPGDTYQGVYRFDSLTAPNGGVVSADPVQLGQSGTFTLAGPTTPGQYLEFPYGFRGTDVTVTGNVSVPSLNATNLTIKAGSILTHPATVGTNAGSLTLNVTGTLTVEPTAAIDVSGRGYGSTTTYPGATSGADWAGGSHVGASGNNGSSPSGSTYGSVYRPQEAGGGAVIGGAGGGIVRVSAGTLALDGTIRANGSLSSRGGGGGSVWVTATVLGGSGSIEAKGGEQQYEAGGGGAIAVEYTSATGSVLTNLVARGGVGQNAGASGGAGSVFVRGPASTFGDLKVDNRAVSGRATVLPSFGSGTAQAGTSGPTVVMDKVAWPGTYFAGHWVEVRNPGGTLKGTWRIGSVRNSTAERSLPGDWGNSLQDGNVYDGYLISSAIRVVDHPDLAGHINYNADSRTFGARYSGGQWQYDNNSSFIPFTPDASDRVFATYKGGVSNIVRLTCPLGACGVVNGLSVLPLVAGDITPNFDPGSPNAGEIWTHDLVFSSSLAGFTLVPNGAETIDVQPGDTYQGVYRFDTAPTIAGNATLSSLDPIRIGGTLVQTEPLAAASTPPASGILQASLCSDLGAALKPGSSFVACADVDARDVTLDVSGAFEAHVAGYGNCRDPIAIPGSARPGPLTIVASARDAAGRTASAATRALVVADEQAPVLVSVEPSSAAALRSGDPLRVAVDAWDDVGIASVAITLGGRRTILTEPPFELRTLVPPVAMSESLPVLVEVFDPSGNVSRRTIDLEVLPAGARLPVIAPGAPETGISLENGRLAVDGGWPWRDADGETRGRTLELPAIGTHSVLSVDGAIAMLNGTVARAAVHGGSVDVRRNGGVVGRFRVLSVSEDGSVVRLEAGAAGAVQRGDFLEGNWVFDSVELTRGAVLRATDSVETRSLHVDASSLFLSKNLRIPSSSPSPAECASRGPRPDPPGTAPASATRVTP